MSWWLVLCVATGLASGVRADCDACFDGRCYRKQLIHGAEGTPADIDRNTNTLYVVDEERHRIKQCNLVSATCKDTAFQWNISAIAIDQRTGDIYGSVYPGLGIYKLDLVNNNKYLLDSSAVVWRMTFRNKVYYARLGGGGIMASEGGRSRMVADTDGFKVRYLSVDKNGDIYYDIFSGGVLVKAGGRTNLLDDYFHIAIDKNGDATLYNWLTKAVYRVTNGQQVEIGAVGKPDDYIYEPLFDRDNNLIYALSTHRYQLKHVSNAQCTITIRNDDIRIITDTTATAVTTVQL